jgi:hypothetical protein
MMAELARFYGIVVWLIGGGHNPPHVHASYSGTEGFFDIRTGEQVKGDMRGRSLQLIAEWIEIHREELLQMWESQEFKKLDPLP